MKTIHEVPPLTETDKMRFNFWVKKTETCWEWQGQVGTSGYGRTNHGTNRPDAHRVAYVMEHGSIPEGHVIDHKCHNKLCVNPAHLQAVTHKQNLENYLPVRASSGYRGVHMGSHGRYRAVVVHNGKRNYSKYFDTAEEANVKAIEMRNKLFTNNLLDRVA